MTRRLAPYALGGALLGIVGGVALALGLWAYTWVVWFVYFGVVEGLALTNSTPGDTLSEHVWQWFTVGGGRPVTGWVRLKRVVLLAFVVWLGVHFVGGGELV